MLPGMFDTAAVMDEFMDLLGLVNGFRFAEVQDFIADPAYLRNFFGLAKKIAPDGERVRQVGFTATRGGAERSVELTAPASELVAPPIPQQPEPEGETIELRGVLRYADATRGRGNQIRIVDTDNEVTHRVYVPTGMMNDLVRPMWDSRVFIRGTRTGDRITLDTIDQDESDWSD